MFEVIFGQELQLLGVRGAQMDTRQAEAVGENLDKVAEDFNFQVDEGHIEMVD